MTSVNIVFHTGASVMTSLCSMIYFFIIELMVWPLFGQDSADDGQDFSKTANESHVGKK